MSKRLLPKAIFLALALLIGLSFFGFSYCYASPTLWYNGDFNFEGGIGLANELNTEISQSNVYDDFIVSGPGWIVDTVWSNNLMGFTGVAEALWEIWAAPAPGQNPTPVASGVSSTVPQEATGRSAFGFTEYTIEVTGLAVFLSPGTYWLTVAPYGFGYCGSELNRSFISSTGGANAIGIPPGNNQNAFIDSDDYGYDYAALSGLYGGIYDYDYSMGVGGRIVPEPATFSLLSLGLLGAGLAKRKREVNK